VQESALSIGHFGASDAFRAVLMFLKNSDVKRGTACMHDAIKVLHDAPKPLVPECGFIEVLVAISSELTASGQQENAALCYEALLGSDGLEAKPGLAIWVLAEICRLQNLFQLCIDRASCGDGQPEANAMDPHAATEPALARSVLCFERVIQFMHKSQDLAQFFPSEEPGAYANLISSVAWNLALGAGKREWYELSARFFMAAHHFYEASTKISEPMSDSGVLELVSKAQAALMLATTARYHEAQVAAPGTAVTSMKSVQEMISACWAFSKSYGLGTESLSALHKMQFSVSLSLGLEESALLRIVAHAVNDANVPARHFLEMVAASGASVPVVSEGLSCCLSRCKDWMAKIRSQQKSTEGQPSSLQDPGERADMLATAMECLRKIIRSAPTHQIKMQLCSDVREFADATAPHFPTFEGNYWAATVRLVRCVQQHHRLLTPVGRKLLLFQCWNYGVMALKYAKMKDASEWADMTMKFMPCKHPTPSVTAA